MSGWLSNGALRAKGSMVNPDDQIDVMDVFHVSEIWGGGGRAVADRQ